MKSTKPIPTSLKIVAILFLINGIFAVIDVIEAFMNNTISVNFSVLELFIGLGLLRLSRGWHKVAIVYTWIGLIMIAISIVVFMLASDPLEFSLFDQQVGHVSKEWGVGLVGGFFLIMLWIYRVLTRPDVRELFEGVGEM